MSVGANIKKRRLELRMSQQELADAMGYRTRSTIAKIESGENDVSQRKLMRFAAALDTTAEALISGMSMQSAHPEQAAVPGKGNRNIAVILAGGKTGKNQQNIPSQFISVFGKPVIVYCMEVYQSHPSIDAIYVVCSKDWEQIVSAYARQYGIAKLRSIIPAGNCGTASLRNAVNVLRSHYAPEDFVLVQEATRPLVTAETISKLLMVCSEKGSATICHSMQEYVQFDISDGHATYVDRNSVIALQSPEAHTLALLTEVFDEAETRESRLTESCCTMLLYHLGYDINFVETTVNNIKLSREEDLATFGALIRK